MNINPYEAPKAAPIQASAPTIPSGEPHQPWSPSEVIGAAWQLVKPFSGKAWVMAVIAVLVMALPIAAVVVAFGGKFDKDGPSTAYTVTSTLVYLPFLAFVHVGIVRSALLLVRGEEPSFGTLFSGVDRVLPVLVVEAIQGVVSLVLTLVLPQSSLLTVQLCFGIVFGTLTLLAVPLIVDAGRSPIDALGESVSTIGSRYFARTIGLEILCLLVVMLFALPCGIPAPIGGAVYAVARAIVYTRITGRTSPVA
jgi:hypothetical protein